MNFQLLAVNIYALMNVLLKQILYFISNLNKPIFCWLHSKIAIGTSLLPS